MTTLFKLALPFLATLVIGNTASAQNNKEHTLRDKEQKSEEIIIRKKGGKTEKMTIVVDGDNVTINGKPAADFKNEDIRIERRDRAIAMAPGARNFEGPRNRFGTDKFDFAMPPSNKAMLGIMTAKSDEGVKVAAVTKESAAEKAGLKKDDIITKVGSKDVKDPKELVEAIAAYKPHDKVNISYKRNGKESKTTAVLEANKPRAYAYNLHNRDFNFEMPEGTVPPLENFNFNFNRKPKIGLQIQDVEEGKGVTVKDVDEDSPAAKAGIKDGDVITQVNGKDIANVDELRNLMKDLKEGETVKLSFLRSGKVQNAEVKIPKKLKTADL